MVGEAHKALWLCTDTGRRSCSWAGRTCEAWQAGQEALLLPPQHWICHNMKSPLCQPSELFFVTLKVSVKWHLECLLNLMGLCCVLHARCLYYSVCTELTVRIRNTSFLSNKHMKKTNIAHICRFLNWNFFLLCMALPWQNNGGCAACSSSCKTFKYNRSFCYLCYGWKGFYLFIFLADCVVVLVSRDKQIETLCMTIQLQQSTYWHCSLGAWRACIWFLLQKVLSKVNRKQCFCHAVRIAFLSCFAICASCLPFSTGTWV